ncbi:MAG: hypothetical protein ACOYKE_13210, partial [Ferruginibacter sp.]
MYLVYMNRIYQTAAAALYVVLFFLLFPTYRYVLDIDAISYIHVAERYLNGHALDALNGYWSPLISWSLMPFIKAGFDPVIAAKYFNGVLGLLSLFTAFKLFNTFQLPKLFKAVYPFILAVFFISFTFYELCADLLQLWLLLLYINTILSKNFIENNYKIILAAILSALCYYAKAYSLPFYLVHFSITLYVLLRIKKTPNLWKILLKKLSIGFAVFFVLTTPYIYAISSKYGSFRINNAGKLNTSWFLSPGISDTRKMIAEPPFVDATSYWDEPTYAQEKLISPFTSAHFFFVQIKWTISNIIKFSGMLNTMSVFTYLIVFGFIFYL